MTLIDAIAEIVSERGYLVVSETQPMVIGHRFTTICELEQPFVIVSVTTVADVLIQRKLLEEKVGLTFDGDLKGYVFHYRAMTD